MGDDSATGEDPAELRRWRRVSSLLVWVQLPAIAAAFPLIVFADGSYRTWVYLSVGTAVALELAQAVVARLALRRVPIFSAQERYAAMPLPARDRRFVGISLVSYPVVLVFSVATINEGSFDTAVATLLVIMANLPTLLLLLRVWRHNSWAAVSRMAIEPRHRQAG